LAVLLSAFTTSVSKFGYRLGIGWASTHLSWNCCTSRQWVDPSERCGLAGCSPLLSAGLSWLAGCLPLLPLW
jgi:hypothetical protein